MPRTKLYNGACGDHSGSTGRRAEAGCERRHGRIRSGARLQREQVLRYRAGSAATRRPPAPLTGGARLGGGDVAALAVVGVAHGRKLGNPFQALGV